MNLDDHLAKMRHDWAFLGEIEAMRASHEFAAWSTVVLFYSALGLMDAFLHASGRDHGRSHTERERALGDLVRNRRLTPGCLDSYALLASQARSARYSQPSLSRETFEALVQHHFRSIEAEVGQRLRLEPLERLPFEPQAS